MSGTSKSDFATLLDGRSLRFERVLAAPVEQVWRFLTQPELLAGWLAIVDRPLEMGELVEFRILLAEDQPSRTVLHGTVKTCEPPRLLTYSWDDPRSSNESFVTFALTPAGASVRLVLTQKGIGDGGLSTSAAGWHVFLGRLEDRLEKRASRPFAEVYNEALEVYEEMLTAEPAPSRAAPGFGRDVALHVHSFEAATELYGEVLGLEVVTRQEGLVGFEAGAFRLYVERGGPPGLGPVLELFVPDLAKAREKLEARGCEVIAEDPEIPRCYVRDPFGLVFNLSER